MRWAYMKISVTNILYMTYGIIYAFFLPLKFDDLICDEKGVPWDATWQIF